MPSGGQLLVLVFPSTTPLPAAFQFSFLQPATGSEATANVNVAVPIMMTTNPSGAILTQDTIVEITISGGSATGRLISFWCM